MAISQAQESNGMLNLDTHIFIDFFAGNLDGKEREKIQKQPLAISAIVLWEIAKLIQLNKLEFDFESPAFLRSLNSFKIIPISHSIAVQSTRLDFKADPADEIISATSIVEKIPLLTRDKKINKSKIVPLA